MRRLRPYSLEENSMKIIIMTVSIILSVVFCGISKADEQAVKQTWTKKSSTGIIEGTIYPQEKKYILNDFHNWVIELVDDKGKAIVNAQITIGGGMQGHGHGLPTQPIVTRQLREGMYLIEGVLFNMAGDWTLLFNVDSASGLDQIQYQLKLVH